MKGRTAKKTHNQTQDVANQTSLQIGGSPTCWKDLVLKKEILSAIHEMGYDRPSQIQLRALPAVIQGQDVIYQAKSGMGKTSVFVIGILNNMTLQTNKEYLPHQCIVIAHTRELAYQITQQFTRHAKYLTQVRFACFFGGRPIQLDKQILCDKSKTPHVIIGTTGRLLDLLQRGYINLKSCKYLVVDECDYMLKQRGENFNEVRFLMDKISKRAQKIMLSATISQEIVSYCKEIMSNHNPAIIKIDEGKLSLTGLTQFYKIIHENHKSQALQHILDSLPFDQAIIFVNRIERVNKIADLLDELLFNPIRIHSGLTQKQRINHYDLFKQNASRILVATNLFGRGIDIQRVNLVINFDFPFDKQTYLHRVGRAGRFGGKGVVINFIRDDVQENGQSDEQNLKAFCSVLNSRIAKLPSNYDVAQYM